MNRVSFQKVTPKREMRSRASRIVGIIVKSSNSRSATQSKIPPNQPARMPIGIPITSPITVAPMAMVIEVRAPQITLVSVSRPSWSVPKRCSGPGGCSD